MQGITFDVAVENTAFPFVLGDLRDEPEFLRRITAPRGFHLVLDLHNVFVVASNAGISPWSYLESIPWEKVIELHVSGGSTTDVGWLTDDEVLRLDSHDDVIPDPVWQMLEHAVARCANVRGVTLERMEGTVEAGDVPVLREELGRIRWIVERHAH